MEQGLAGRARVSAIAFSVWLNGPTFRAGRPSGVAQHSDRAGRDAAPQAQGDEREAQLEGAVPGAASLFGLQRSAGNQAVVQLLQKQGLISRPGDPYEQEAGQIARSVMEGSPPAAAASVADQTAVGASDEAAGIEAGLAQLGSGTPLPGEVRAFMEPRYGADFGDVRVHTGGAAGQLNADLEAEAFTYGSDIYYGSGRGPAADTLTAHELSHVVQQTGGGRARAASRIGTKRIQPSFSASYPVTQGVFEIDWQTREGAVATPPTHSGFDGYMRFVPNPDAPNSNSIVFVQIFKLTDLGKNDVGPVTMSAGAAPRGSLGQPGARTKEDTARGIEGGFVTDVDHQPSVSGPATPAGSALSPDYDFQPASSGVTGVGQTAQPSIYGGGIGGVPGRTPGFKRSSEPADIRSAAMFDTPGTTSTAHNINFEFESVVKGEDTMIVYGAVKWGFGLRAGKVVNEYLIPVDAASATFDEAIERHRDYYVHEPVTFYFDFDSDALSASEAAKIDTFLPYLKRNPKTRMFLEGLADIQGGASRHNLDLSLRRASAVSAALVAKGVDAGRIDDILVGQGASTSATRDAGTGDQGGRAALGADQSREANRWANRRVVLTFFNPPPGAAAAAPAAGP